jgi:hypothetical protein
MADSRFFFPTPSFNALRLLLWTVVPVASFWVLHGGYFAWDGYQTALEGWDLVGVHALLVGLAWFSESSKQMADPHAEHALGFLPTTSWVLLGSGALQLAWNSELSLVGGLVLLAVATVWGYRMAPAGVLPRFLALALGAGFPWLIWTLDLLPTLQVDNHEFQLQTLPVVGVFSLLTGVAGWIGHAQTHPFELATAQRWERRLAWTAWSLVSVGYAVLFVQIGLWKAALPGLLAGGLSLAAGWMPQNSVQKRFAWGANAVGLHVFAAAWLLWTTWILQHVEPVVG